MNVVPSERVKTLAGYAFAEVDKEVAQLRKDGIRIIDFGVGDPREPTPAIVRNTCKKAVEKRKSSGYPSYIGSQEFREAAAEWTKKRFKVTLNPEKEIASSIGAKEGVFNFHEGFVNSGDYVISPNPGYPPYERGALFAEGRVYFLPLLKENNFLMDLESIPAEIVKKTKILWINYPNNPTAAVATDKFLREVVDFGQDNNIIVASDECYTELYYEKKPRSILEFAREGVVVAQSLSKRSNMTTYRVGWFAGDERIIDVFKKVKTNIDSGTATFVQDAAIAALKDEKHVELARKNYRKKRNIMIRALTSAGLENCAPQATLYIWQRIPQGYSSVSFSKKLLRGDTAIATTPGEWVAKEINHINPGKNYVRLALVPTIVECEEAAERLRNLKL